MTGSRKLSLTLLAVGFVILVIALLVGISDNPPGIVLLYLAVLLMMLSVVQNWRSIKKFLILAATSLIGVPAFSILHNLFEALAELNSDILLLNSAGKVLSGLCFLIAVIVCQ